MTTLDCLAPIRAIHVSIRALQIHVDPCPSALRRSYSLPMVTACTATEDGSVVEGRKTFATESWQRSQQIVLPLNKRGGARDVPARSGLECGDACEELQNHTTFEAAATGDRSRSRRHGSAEGVREFCGPRPSRPQRFRNMWDAGKLFQPLPLRLRCGLEGRGPNEPVRSNHPRLRRFQCRDSPSCCDRDGRGPGGHRTPELISSYSQARA